MPAIDAQIYATPEMVRCFVTEATCILKGADGVHRDLRAATIIKYMSSTLEDSFFPAQISDISTMLGKTLTNVSVFETHEVYTSSVSGGIRIACLKVHLRLSA